jgi:predicted ATPase
VGKTRLSLQVAAELLTEFEDGVWFAELAPISEPGFLAETVASALGVPASPTITAEQRLMEFLPDRNLLLVMDNCEHLIDHVAALVDTLLRSCPRVHALTTSREGLALPGEVLWRVPSLRVDDDAAAVELFADRARLIQPGFSVNDDNIDTVAELCVRLDGIPLAIELATARLQMLSLDQISELLNDRFRLLTGGGRTAVERQRTLRAMMDWSYDLLSAQEQALLRRLSVFSGGFTYAAAEDVCSGETLARYEVLDLLAHLVEASMVIFESERRPRYQLLETVRQYALDKLIDAGEADEARLRHAEYFRAASEELSDALNDGKVEMVEVGTDDLANYRSAMTWSSEAGHNLLFLELATNLRVYFWDRAMFREALNWLTAALDRVDDDTSPLVATATAYALSDANNVGGDAPTWALADRARRILDSSRDDLSRGILTNALGTLEMSIDARRSDQLFAEAVALLRGVASPRWVAPLQNRFLIASLANSREAEGEVLSLLDEAEGVLPAPRIRVGRTVFKLIAEEYEEVLAASEELDPVDEYARIMMLVYRMQAQRATGHPEAALESNQRFTAMPSAIVDGWRGWHLGMAHLQLGDLDAAVESFSAPGAYNLDLPAAGDQAGVAWFWSMIAERRGQYEPAALLMGYADALSERAWVNLLAFDNGLLEQSRTAVREGLGEKRYDELHHTGVNTCWEDLPLVHR